MNDIDYSDNTPLHYAAADGNEDLITYLLERNARVTVASNGNTPLHVVSRKIPNLENKILFITGSSKWSPECMYLTD